MKNYVMKAGRSFLVTLMAILILMGIVFFFLHINHIPGFWETDEIIRIQTGGAYDEYTDYLYPVLVGIFIWLQQVTGITFIWLLYSLQAGLLLFALYKFIGVFGLFRSNYVVQSVAKKLFFALFLLCNPFVMQMMVSVLPYGFAVSSLLLTFTVYLKKQYDLHYFIQGIIGIILTGLLMKELMWLLLLSLLLHQMYLFLGRRRQALPSRWFILLLVLVGIGISIFQSLVQVEGSQGKVFKSKESRLIQAYIYPDYDLYYPHFEAAVRERLSEEEAKILSEREGNLIYYGMDFFSVGQDNQTVNKLYASMFQTVFEMNTKNTMLKAWKKSMDYLFTPMTVLDNFQGDSQSMTGWNYSRMTELHPVFSAIYMKFGVLFLSFCFGLVVLAKIFVAVFYKKVRVYELPLPFFILILVNGFFYGIFSTTSFDYRNSMIIIILSLTYFVILTFRTGKYE